MTLDHADNCFRLPALSVSFLVESGLHQSAVLARGARMGRTSGFGGDQGSNGEFIPSEGVIRFAVVSCVGNNRLDPNQSTGSLYGLFEFGDIGTRPSRGMSIQHHMSLRIADDAELGKPLISRGLIEICLARAPFDVVRTTVV